MHYLAIILYGRQLIILQTHLIIYALLKTALSNAEYSRLLQNTLNLCNGIVDDDDDDGGGGGYSSDMLLQTTF